ncbi:MAG: YraN family protein [Lachnospiraceae bacterium]|nr:YraN family protein [Lachnospiraceae bacterium]
MEGVDGINKRETGTQYEKVAAEFLRGKGYNILMQNYYCRYGEIDIIAEENGYTVFIEVKYRKNTVSGSPESAVNSIKIQHIRKAALDFITSSYGTEEIPCRFDIVAITGNQIHLIKDAF